MYSKEKSLVIRVFRNYRFLEKSSVTFMFVYPRTGLPIRMHQETVLTQS